MRCSRCARRQRSSAWNSIQGKIIGVTQVGATFKVHLDNGLTALVTKQAIEELGLEIGEVVYASFKATSIHLTRR